MKPSKRLVVAKPSEPRGFYDLAKAHVEAHGGVWFVADRGKTPQQWRAWIAYFAWLDDQTTPKGGKAAVFRKLEALTVPAEWPLEFDASAPPAPPPEPAQEPISPERRKQLAAMLRSVVAEHELKDRRAPSWRDMTPAQAGDKLADLAAAYARTPPTASAELMGKYLEGMRPELDDAADF